MCVDDDSSTARNCPTSLVGTTYADTENLMAHCRALPPSSWCFLVASLLPETTNGPLKNLRKTFHRNLFPHKTNRKSLGQVLTFTYNPCD
ncbi:hypothetical protein AMTR_s00031p00049930 [Amborella trichopoda]|uniref:Uncharacterized protein n=1 Tax=Amborella trichopoda TaxID=13333 RepID=U5D2M6_AMBTC|nr:hypothetical protein AMTR_s00031p00049930 [Amborella trichopoda]